MIRDFLHTLYDRIQQPEVQMTGTAGASATYAFTLNEWVGALTIVLLLAQLGLAAFKYRELWQKKKAKQNGTKE
jgi:hypothetical protein